VAPRLSAIYHVRCDAGSVEARAREIAIEQSIEMPLSAVDDDFVLSEVVGRVAGIREREQGLFEVTIALSADTMGQDPGQLINMLFGNTSLHQDVALADVALEGGLAQAFGGPRHGPPGLKRRVGASERALTCSALKPQGLSAAQLADLARRFAQGGIDYIKDDHGLADQSYSPFRARVEAVTAAVQAVERPGAAAARYVPSLSGDLDSMRRQLGIATGLGVDTVMIAPMIVGFSNFHRLVRDNPQIAFIAHPSLGGAARIAPALLFGKLFRMFGADAVVFPNHGGRFGYTPDTCRELARTALAELDGLRACLPVPAGGMTTDRVCEMLAFYGPDVMLLIGGALLEARDRLTAATAAFVAEVHDHVFG
jgi:ribulose-bisphosphate carboxylase large chain